jgi:hypothetical protein
LAFTLLSLISAARPSQYNPVMSERRYTIRECIAVLAFFLFLWGSMAMFCFLSRWQNCVYLREQAIARVAPFGIQVPPDWKAVTISVAEGLSVVGEDSNTPLGVNHWPFGTVRQNPIGFAIGVGAFILLAACTAAIPIRMSTGVRQKSKGTDTLPSDST